MGETKIDKKSNQYNAIPLDLNKACERNILHRDMTCFAYFILDHKYQIEDAYDTFILPSLSYGANTGSTTESKDYEMSLLNFIEYQQHILTEI